MWITWHQHSDLVFDNVQCPVERIRQAIWDTLQNYGRIEWKSTPSDVEKAPDVANQDVLNKSDSFRGVKGLIPTHSSLGKLNYR
jgi:hypothetical protein